MLTQTGFSKRMAFTDVKNERNLIENKETYLPCHGYSDRSVCTCRIIFLTPFTVFTHEGNSIINSVSLSISMSFVESLVPPSVISVYG